jgi:hypothetical protein
MLAGREQLAKGARNLYYFDYQGDLGHFACIPA